jgi:hypothetical protein
MQKRTRFVVGIILGTLGLSAGVGAAAFVWTDRQMAGPCGRTAVFARTINASPSDAGYYFAANCETVYADTVTVVLPTLTGQADPQQITIRNIGVRTVIVGARGPADSIDPMVEGYTPSYPAQPIFDGGQGYLLLSPQSAVTITAMPAQLPNAWFVETRGAGALTLPPLATRDSGPKPAER